MTLAVLILDRNNIIQSFDLLPEYRLRLIRDGLFSVAGWLVVGLPGALVSYEVGSHWEVAL